MLDRRAAQLELARRGRVRRPQPPLGDLEEPGGARVQRLRGQRLEPLGQLALDQRGPFGRGALDHPGPILSRPGVPVRRRDPAARVQVSDRCPDENPEQQSDQQQERTHMPHDLTVRAEPGADTPGTPRIAGIASSEHNGAMAPLTAWMPLSCRPSSMNAASTPYAGGVGGA